MARGMAGASFCEVCHDYDLVSQDSLDSEDGEEAFSGDARSKKSVEPRAAFSAAKSLDIWRDSSWMVSPNVWWRHPAWRILVTYIIMGLDFYIFVEDPVQDSHVDYTFIGVGQLYHLIVTWPDGAWDRALRLAVISFVSLWGVVFARQVIHHMLLRDCVKLSMFGYDSSQGSEGQLRKLESNKGTTFVMGFTQLLLLCLFIPFICNLLETGTLTEPLTSQTGKHFAWWGKIWQYISVGLDVITITTVSDLCLQDTERYPDWAAGLKYLWNTWCDGCVRIATQWIFAPLCLGLLYYGIHSSGYDVTCECEYVSNDVCRDPQISVTSRGLNMGNLWLGGSSISFRVLIACTCAICDILNLVQDWDFPTFDHGPQMNVLVPFTKLEKIDINCVGRCSIKSCTSARMRKFLEKLLTFEMTAKWFAYMSVWGSLCADLSCMRTQFTYVPSKYGQYEDVVTQRVWNIVDPYWLSLAYADGYLIPERAHLITWSVRKDPSNPYYNETSAASDILLSSRYADSSLRYLAIVPGPLAVVVFAVLVWRGDVHLARYLHNLPHYPRAPFLGCPELICEKEEEESDEEAVMEADTEAADELKESAV